MNQLLKQPNAVTVVDEAEIIADTAPTAPPGMRLVDPFEAYAQRDGSRAFLDGDIISCNGQTGEWSRGLGKNKRPIGPTTSFLCNMNELHIAWLKMVDSKIVDRSEVGRVFDGYQRVLRDELDDYDERAWPIRNGKHEDPWKPCAYLQMRCMDDGENVVFSPFNKTGCQEVGNFARIYRRAKRGGRYPLVLLETRSFKNQGDGTTFAPQFKIVGWDYWEPGVPAPEQKPILVPIALPQPSKALPAPTKRGGGDMDDEIPF